MSTRCEIGIMLNDGTIEAAYCHHDGYLDGGVGEVLWQHYNGDDEIKRFNKAWDLVKGGAMSSIGHNPDDCERYNDSQKNIIYKNEAEYLENFGDIEYRYLFKNHKWYYTEPGCCDFFSLSDAFIVG